MLIVDCIVQVLSEGVKVNGQSYSFLGSSQGQLRERTAVLYSCDSPADAWDVLQRWGDFSNIQNVAKLYKRVSLMFSGGCNLELGHVLAYHG